ncbi:winged helix-turn-helix transcriptional regulator [Nonomuraea sp. MG754425]|uniref:MarR family winged helix-turn-helix transcriptional regulator n=1 Tax=Nonomuraea sp. MG754425 TaxID=2570319 RepID=UPI001F3F1BBC|nr:MarR family winged helix-turn-helix transcriptional regulator [Nonomuraea sp. MG754425]MCF6467829.1 winged helix-turn-helix transcriptional regulator [Nonomuraea sp. MG754425]
MDDTKLATGLVRLAHLVSRVYAEVSREFELTPQQIQLLCVLLDGPTGMTEMSRALGLEKSSMTGLVDRAERRGIVVRVRDQRDRRACDVALTEQGRTIAHAAHRKVTAQVEALVGAIDPGDRERLESVVTGIVRGRDVLT